MRSRLWLAIWVGVIVVVGVPWRTLEAHAHWERVAWIPFISPPVEFFDVVANVLLYVPYGVVCGLDAGETRNPIVMVTVSATGLSLATELVQVFSGSRFPSMTDVTCNVLGAFIAVTWASRLRARKS